MSKTKCIDFCGRPGKVHEPDPMQLNSWNKLWLSCAKLMFSLSEILAKLGEDLYMIVEKIEQENKKTEHKMNIQLGWNLDAIKMQSRSNFDQYIMS